MTPRPEILAKRGRARRRPVPSTEPLIGTARFDYADSFEIELGAEDSRGAEAIARSALEQAPWWVHQIVLFAHRHVLRIRLAPIPSPGHIHGMRIATVAPDLIHVEAESPLARGAIIGRRSKRGFALTTYLWFRRPHLMRLVWTGLAPVHRKVAAYLLERVANTSSAHDGELAPVTPTTCRSHATR